MTQAAHAGSRAHAFLLAMGYSERGIQRAARGDLATEAGLTCSRFLHVLGRLWESDDESVDPAVRARFTEDTWHGAFVLGRLDHEGEADFAPSYEDEASQAIASSGTWVASAGGFQLWERDEDGVLVLYQLGAGEDYFEEGQAEAARELGSFADWLSEGEALARAARGG